MAKKRAAYARDHKLLEWNLSEGLIGKALAERWNNTSLKERKTICPNYMHDITPDDAKSAIYKAKSEKL